MDGNDLTESMRVSGAGPRGGGTGGPGALGRIQAAVTDHVLVYGMIVKDRE